MPINAEYKEAAQHQHKIAVYFYKQLEQCYNPTKFNSDDENTIKTQAYFEGCIRAAYSCLDKLCEGTLKVKNAASAVNNIEGALREYRLGRIKEKSSLINELRILRNDMTHKYTTKAPQGEGIYITFLSGTYDIKTLSHDAVDLTKKAIVEAGA